MKCDLKETAVFLIPKEHLVFLKGDKGLKEHIVTKLSSELAERIMGILEREEEIIVRQSDLRVSEFIPTNSVEYRRQINWCPLVRCKDCKHFMPLTGYSLCVAHGSDAVDADDFCSWAERKETDDGEIHS